jgi:hypothetical protein
MPLFQLLGTLFHFTQVAAQLLLDNRGGVRDAERCAIKSLILAYPSSMRQTKVIRFLSMSCAIEIESPPFTLNAQADEISIVIVHGLQGHPFKTWASNKTPNASSDPESSLHGLSRKRKTGHRYFLRRVVSKVSTKHPGEAASTGPDRSEPSITNANNDAVSVFWPGDLAPDDCPRSRILVYGYDTKVSKYMSAPTNKNHVFSHGKDLLYALGRERKQDRSLVFLAHSLGGIVVKEVRVTCLKLCNSC